MKLANSKHQNRVPPNHNHPIGYLAERVTRRKPLSLLFEQQPNYPQGTDTLSEIPVSFAVLS